MIRRYFSVAFGLARRLLDSCSRSPGLFLPPLLMPIFFFIAFAGGLSAVTEEPDFNYPGGYTAFEFGFVLMQAAAFGGVFTGFSIAADFQFGFGNRLMLATPNRTRADRRLRDRGARPRGDHPGRGHRDRAGRGHEHRRHAADLVAMYGLAAIVNVAGTLFSAGVALRFRSLQATPLMMVPTFLFLFLAPVYVPRDLLTGWVGAVSDYDPATHIMETGRELLAGQAADFLAALAIALGLVGADVGLRHPRPAQGRGRGIVAAADGPPAGGRAGRESDVPRDQGRGMSQRRTAGAQPPRRRAYGRPS